MTEDELLSVGDTIRHTTNEQMHGKIAERAVQRSDDGKVQQVEYLITWDNEWYGPSEIESV